MTGRARPCNRALFETSIAPQLYQHVRRADWWASAADRPQWPMQKITVPTAHGRGGDQDLQDGGLGARALDPEASADPSADREAARSHPARQVIGVAGAGLPIAGVLRFGGDGRGAAVREGLFEPPQPDLQGISRSGRCRLVLTAPGLFPHGWRPPGADDGGIFDLCDVRARLVCAAVARAEVVSGWDLAQWQPKPALRAAPSGSVYWLEDLEATPEALRKLAERGLWTDAQYALSTRRAEGFNRVALAAWGHGS